jgi:hypothetical protein
VPINLENEKKAAEAYVFISKSMPKTPALSPMPAREGVKLSPKETPIEERIPRGLSPRQKLESYLRSIGQQ